MLRALLLANMVGLNVFRRDNFEHPTAGVVVVGVLVAWTVFALWAYAEPARRTPLLLVVDLAFALLGLAVSPWLKGADFNATVGGFWVMGAMLVWAVQWRVVGGLVAAVLLCVTDVLSRDHITESNYGNLFLLMIGGPLIGYVADSLQRSGMAVAAAERVNATQTERARLARAVHDGVLQVLALVQRSGGELGRLAGEQESRLRALIRAQDSMTPPVFGDVVDLAVELARFEEHGAVTVSLPGMAVPMPAHAVDEIVAAVSACISQHPRARRSQRAVVGAARGLPRPGRGVRARRGSRHPRRPPRGRRRRRAAGCDRVDPGPDPGPGRHRRGDLRQLRDRVGADRASRRPMTIHSDHPFRDAESDPVRQLRSRLGGAVTLWTSGTGDDVFEWAGLTVTSVLVANGEPARLLALLDPDSDLADTLGSTGRAVVAVLTWEERALADAFAGTAPAPGGPFRQAEFATSPWGPRLASATTWAGVRLESSAPVGWSSLVTCVVDEVTIGEGDALIHRRGRYQRPADPGPGTRVPAMTEEPAVVERTRVMVVDDHPMWRDAVERDLAAAGFDVVAVASDGDQAIARFPAARPQVVVLDLQIPGPNGVEVTAKVLEHDPSARVLILSASGEQDDVLDAVKAGATGYLVKSANSRELVEAVTRVAAGDTVFTPGLAGLVLGEFRRMLEPASKDPATPELTERETEILKMVAKGMSYKAIAERLVISHRTVQNHVQSTLRKLQMHNRVELTRYAIEQGLDDDDD